MQQDQDVFKGCLARGFWISNLNEIRTKKRIWDEVLKKGPWLLSICFHIFRGELVEFFFEAFGEIGGVGEPGFNGDFEDRAVVLLE